MANVILYGTSLTSASLQEIFRVLAQGGVIELTRSGASPAQARGGDARSLRVAFGFAYRAATVAAEEHLSRGGALLFLTRPSQLAGLVASLTNANLPARTCVQLLTPSHAVPLGALADAAHSVVRAQPATEQALGLCLGDIESPLVAQTLLTSYQSHGPLAGKRVLVLRASHQQGTVEEELDKRCAQTVSQPLIGIHDLMLTEEDEQTLLNPHAFDLVTFTSENSVEAYFRRLEHRQRGVETFARTPLAAIGETTRQALAKRGLTVAFIPTLATGEGFAEAIAAYFAGQASANRKVLLPRALVAREALPNLLREAGFEVRTVALYENRSLTQASAAALAELLRAQAVDIALLTSGSIAEAFADIVQQQNLTKTELGSLQLASIGTITTEAARKRGLSIAVTAQESSITGLIRSLEQFNSELERG